MHEHSLAPEVDSVPSLLGQLDFTKTGGSVKDDE